MQQLQDNVIGRSYII